MDYSNLRELLKIKQWKEANQLTKELILKLANREEEGYLDAAASQILPTADLVLINQLWLEFSHNHFGFSVQRSIVIEVNQQYNKALDHINSFVGDQSYLKFWFWEQILIKYLGWDRNIAESLEIDDILNTPRGYLPWITINIARSIDHNQIKDMERIGGLYKLLMRRELLVDFPEVEFFKTSSYSDKTASKFIGSIVNSRKIEALKLYRELTGASLFEARQAIEKLGDF